MNLHAHWVTADTANGPVSTWRVVHDNDKFQAIVANARASSREPQRWYFNVAGRAKPNAFDRLYYDTDQQAFNALRLELARGVRR
jgi:hypothetical protein